MSDPDTRARSRNPLLSAFGRVFEGVLNRSLALDAPTRERLRPLDGQAITMTFQGTGMAMRIAVDGEQLRVGPAFEGSSALRVAATPGSLLGVLLARGSGDAALAPGKVEIAGDAELARRIEKIASQFQPDIDEAFTRVFGDVIGFQLARTFRAGFAWTRESAGALMQDTAAHLRDDRGDLVSRPEVEDFLHDVDVLREHSDRLAARVRRLRERGPRAS